MSQGAREPCTVADTGANFVEGSSLDLSLSLCVQDFYVGRLDRAVY